MGSPSSTSATRTGTPHAATTLGQGRGEGASTPEEPIVLLRPFPEDYARFTAQHGSNDMRLFAVSIPPCPCLCLWVCTHRGGGQGGEGSKGRKESGAHPCRSIH
jgi:hypothetical protein